MVTLRPGHPHPIASAGPANGFDGFARLVRSFVSNRRPGRHRTRMDWNTYRSKHQDAGRSGSARLLPSWGSREPSPEPLTSVLPILDETPDIDGTSTGVPLPVTRDISPKHPDLEPTAVHPVTPAGSPSPSQANGGAAVTQAIHATSSSVAVTDPPIETRAPVRAAQRLSRPSTTMLHRSRLLPLAHPREGSSLATLLGFGSKEATFGGDWTNGNLPKPPNDPVDDPWTNFPSLGTVTAGLDRRGNTGDTVKMLWDATAELDLGGGLLPTDAPEARLPLRSPRRVRWSLVISCTLLAVLMAATIKVISDFPQREAALRHGQYVEATGQLSEALTPIEQSLRAGGLLSDSGLSSLASRVSTLDAAARASSTLAFEQLPRPPIIGSSQSVDELVVPKQLMEAASVQAIGIGERIRDAMSYSVALSTAFSIPALPAEASPSDVDRIAEQLSFSIAETRLALSGLPDDPFFGTFRQHALDTASALEVTHAAYVTALREGDTAAATEAGLAIQESIAVVHDRIESPLEQVQTWALGQVMEIRTALTDIQSLLEQSA